MGDLIQSINNKWNVYSDGSGNLAGNLTVTGDITSTSSVFAPSLSANGLYFDSILQFSASDLFVRLTDGGDFWIINSADKSVVDWHGTYLGSAGNPLISGFNISGKNITSSGFPVLTTLNSGSFYPMAGNPSGFLLTGNSTTDVSFRDISGRGLNLTSTIQIPNNVSIQSRLAVGTPVAVLTYNSSNALILGANNEIKTQGSVWLQPPSGGNITASVSGGGVGLLVGPWTLSGNTLITRADTGVFQNSFVSYGETGSAFYPRSGNPSGYLTGSTGGFVNVNQTGVFQDSGRNRIGTLATSSTTFNTTATGGNWYRIGQTNPGNYRFSALVDAAAVGGTVPPCQTLLSVSHDWLTVGGLEIISQTSTTRALTDFRLVRNTGTQQTFLEAWVGSTFNPAGGDLRISVINTDGQTNFLYATWSGYAAGSTGVFTGVNDNSKEIPLCSVHTSSNVIHEYSSSNLGSGVFHVSQTSGVVSTFLGSRAANGTKPINVISRTLCDNLNAELLSGQAGAFYLNVANHVGTGQYVSLVDSREEVANGLTTFNGPVAFTNPARVRNGVGADANFYPCVSFYNFDNPTTGAWVLNTPIPRTSNTQFQIRIQGHGTNSAGGITGNVDILAFGYMQGAISGSIDGLPGAVFPDHCSIRNNSSINVPVWMGVNQSGNLAVGFGDTGTKFYFWRTLADAAIVWNNNTGRYGTGWSWSNETGANFGWGDRKQFSGFQQHLHDAAQIAAGVLPSGRLVGNYPQITGLGTLPALTVNGPMTLSGFTPVTKNDTGALANSFLAFNQTGQFVTTGDSRTLSLVGTVNMSTVNIGGAFSVTGPAAFSNSTVTISGNSVITSAQSGQFCGTGETRNLVFTNATISTLNSSTGTFTTLNVGGSLNVTGPSAFNGGMSTSNGTFSNIVTNSLGVSTGPAAFSGATTISGFTVLTTNDTGLFYPRSNPSGFCCGSGGGGTGMSAADGDTRYIKQGSDLASGQNNNELILFNNDIGYTGFYFDGLYQKVGAYFLYDTYSAARIDLGGTLSSGKQMISGFHMSGITGNFTGLQVQGQRVITIVDSGSFMALDESRNATWRGSNNFIRGSTTVTGGTLTVQNGNLAIPGIGTFGATAALTFSQPISVTGTLSMSGNRVVCVNETGAYTNTFVTPAQTGALSNSFVNFGQTGSAFYPRSGNPSGYLTNATNTGNGSGIINAISSSFVAQVKTLTTGNGIKILGTSSELQVNVNLNYMLTGMATEIDLDTGFYSDLVSGNLGSGIWQINSNVLFQKDDGTPNANVYSRLLTGAGTGVVGVGQCQFVGFNPGVSGYVNIPINTIIFTTGTLLRLQALTTSMPTRALPYAVTNFTASGITGVQVTKFTAVKIG